LNSILRLIAKEYKLFFSDKVAVSLTFIIPMLLIMIWGAIFGKADSGPDNLRLAFLNLSTSPIAKHIEQVLDTSTAFKLVKTYKDENDREVAFDTASIKDYVQKGGASAALVIPGDAYTESSIGLKMNFYYDPRNPMEIQFIQGMLQQTIMAQIPAIVIQSAQRAASKYLGSDSGRLFNSAIARTVGRFFNIDSNTVLNFRLTDTSIVNIGSGGRSNFFRNILQLEKEQLVGKQITNPWATRSVGGWAMMFLMFTLTASAASLFEEKQSGVVLRILASPISRVQILWSKYLYNISLGFIQLLVLFVAGWVLFKIDIFSNLLNLILIVTAAATACTAFGMLLAAISKTAAQARGLGTFLILAMSSIGGAWFPTSFMPDFMQTISKLTIVYWSMDGFLQVLWRGVGTLEILPNLGVLCGIAVLITSISIFQFKKGRVF
jgi:ABC-2 type transport system permease protein